MRKLNEIKELINKICDMTISEEELSDLMIASDEKQELVNAVNDAKASKDLERVKEIIRKVEKRETLSQGALS